MVAAPVALAVVWYRERRIKPMPLITAVVVLVFGAMTIALGDPRFIYLKPTIVSGLLGATLLIALALGRPLLEPVLGEALELTQEGWRQLSLRFGIFSLALAAANEVVWRSVTPHAEHLWVWFKFLGIPGLTLLFMLAQRGLLERTRLAGPESAS